LELFTRQIAGIGRDELKNFLSMRHGYLSHPVHGVTSPCTLPSTDWYRPYENMQPDVWDRVREKMRHGTPHPNPFEPSKLRSGGLYSWDVACGMPACGMRGDTVDVREVPVHRNCNTTWAKSLEGILRVGNMGGTRIKRPSGPYVFDLESVPVDIALKLTDIANVLTGLHRECMDCGYLNNNEYGSTHALYARNLAYVVHATLYDLPIRINPRVPGGPEGYAGNCVRVSTDPVTPVLLAPWRAPDAPVLDRTVTETLVACHLHPHPAGYEQQLVASDYDFLGCQPSFFAVAGWEAVDWITHLGLAKYKFGTKVHYGAQAHDLLPAETYWHALKLGLHTARYDGSAMVTHPLVLREATQAAISKAAEQAEAARYGLYGSDADDAEDRVWLHASDIKWLKPLEWFDTPHFKWAQSRTECLPRREFMRVNTVTEDALRKPRGQVPDLPLKRMPPEWQAWHAGMENIYRVLLASRKHWEGVAIGASDAKASRSARRRQAVRRRKHIMSRCKYEGIVEKLKQGKQPNEADYRYITVIRRADPLDLAFLLPEKKQDDGIN